MMCPLSFEIQKQELKIEAAQLKIGKGFLIQVKDLIMKAQHMTLKMEVIIQLIQRFEQADVSLDDVDAISNESEDFQNFVVEQRQKGYVAPATMNAFELISTSHGLNLNGLFEKQMPRDTCYVASAGLPDLIYSGYHPRAYSWDDFPPLKDILDAVHKMLPGSTFNSLLLNRYKGGNDYVGWHSDDEKLYGSTAEIASVSFGCESDYFLKKKSSKSSQG